MGVLASQAQAARLWLNTTVAQVAVNPDPDTGSTVTVTTTDGRQVRSTAAIVTLPLGVLQAGSVAFVPALPAAKLEVVARMGWGSFHKTFLVFDLPFWQDKASCWLFHERNYSAPAAESAGGGARFFQYWLNMFSFTGVPFLIGFNTGDNARLLATMELAQVKALALAALADMFPGVGEVPPPIEVSVNEWQHDAFTAGAYSYSAVGALPEDANTLAAAVGPLHFAGEATSFQHPGYVHGAFETGIRAAQEVLAQWQAAELQ